MQDIISRKKALDLGLKYYFTGKPCRNGHIAKKATINWTCVECKSAIDAKQYELKSEKIKAKVKEYRDKNSESINDKIRKYYHNNEFRKKRVKEKRDEWRRNNIERVREKSIEYGAKRRTKKTNAGGSFTIEQFKEIKRLQGNKCNYCGAMGKLEADHIIPISRGGTSWAENIQALCVSCNRSKHNKTHDEYMEVLNGNRKNQISIING